MSRSAKMIMALLLSLMLLLTACGGEAAHVETVQTTTVPTTAATEATEATHPTEPEVLPQFRLKKEIWHNGSFMTATEYFYDDQGRLYKAEYSDASGNPTGVREYVLGDGYREYMQEMPFLAELGIEMKNREYVDDMGRVTKMEIYTNGVLGQTMVYNEAGRITQIITENSVTAYEYDEKGNPTAIWEGPNSDSLNKVEEYVYTYTYDDQGRITRAAGPEIHTDYTYSQNQTTEITTYDQESGNIPQGTTTSIVTTYDDYGNVIRKNSQNSVLASESYQSSANADIEYIYEPVSTAEEN